MSKKPEEPKSLGAQLVARRYAKMTPEERSAAARNAATKKWAAVKKQEKARAAKPKSSGARG